MKIQSRRRARRSVQALAGRDKSGRDHRRRTSYEAITEKSTVVAELELHPSAVAAGLPLAVPAQGLPGAKAGAGSPGAQVRTPKVAAVIAQTLRRLIVDGHLREGDYLPNETQLTQQYGVSRSTLREALRLPEAERLVEVRRGARTGARVRIPGSESLARPACLILHLAGANFADMSAARLGIEPIAVRTLAETRTPQDVVELETFLAKDIPTARHTGTLRETVVLFHRRLVDMSGNATLSMIAGMLDEITERHTVSHSTKRHTLARPDYDALLRAYRGLIDHIRAGDGEGAEALWRAHLKTAPAFVSPTPSSCKIRDVVE
jgi:GntR family transcriptional repressor for pyruvate dehydrogenase complex